MAAKKKTTKSAAQKTITKKATAKRVSAKRVSDPLFEVRKSEIQGRGAFAVRPIRKGARIIEYTGEPISNEEADERYDETKMRRHHTFLFTLDDDTVIDGAVGGNESIYINHSCEPNCEAVITRSRIYIHSIQTIQPGEELLYDYQYEQTGENTDELQKFYKCLCGAHSCRGSIMKLAEQKKQSKKQLKSPPKHRKSAGNQRRPKRVK